MSLERLVLYILVGIRGVNNDGILALVVDNQVRIVVTGTHPLTQSDRACSAQKLDC